MIKYIFVVLGTVFSYVCAVGLSYQISVLLDTVQTLDLFTWTIQTILIALFATVFSMIFNDAMPLKLDLDNTKSLMKKSVKNMLFMSQNNYLKNDKGYYFNFASNVVPSCAGLYQQFYTTLPSYIIICLMTLGIAFYSSIAIGIFFVLYIPVSFYLAYLPSKNFFEMSSEALAKQDDYLDSFKTVVENKKQINMLNSEDFYQNKFNKAATSFINFVFKFKLTSTVVERLPSYANNFFQVIVLAISAFLLAKGNLSLGMLFLLYQLFHLYAGPLSGITEIFVRYRANASSFTRLKELEENAKEKIIRNTSKSFIKLENFKLFNDEKKQSLVLDIENLDIKEGEFVVIKGENGTGKSLLFNYILGLENEQFGEGQVSVSTPTEKISLLAYPVLLVKGDFNENNFAKEYNAEISDLLNIDFSQKEITLNPVNLSFGQQQKLNLLRALSKDTQHIVLDEPMTNLDDATKNNVISHLQTLKGLKTIIVITHDTDIEKIADRVLTIQDKQIVSLK